MVREDNNMTDDTYLRIMISNQPLYAETLNNAARLGLRVEYKTLLERFVDDNARAGETRIDDEDITRIFKATKDLHKVHSIDRFTLQQYGKYCPSTPLREKVLAWCKRQW